MAVKGSERMKVLLVLLLLKVGLDAARLKPRPGPWSPDTRPGFPDTEPGSPVTRPGSPDPGELPDRALIVSAISLMKVSLLDRKTDLQR